MGSCLSQSHVGFLIQLSIFIFYSMASAPFAVSFENTHYIKDEILLIYVIAPLSHYSLPDCFLLCSGRIFATA